MSSRDGILASVRAHRPKLDRPDPLPPPIMADIEGVLTHGAQGTRPLSVLPLARG